MIRHFFAAICFAMLVLQAAAAPATVPWLARRFSTSLGPIAARLAAIDAAMEALPVMSDIDALGTHGFHSNFTPTAEDHWFEIAWDTPQDLDGIAIVPTRITTQSGRRSNYGFPSRLRIEATRAGVPGRFVLAEISETRLDLRRGEPLFRIVEARSITSLRFVPEELPTMPGKTVRFFSLAEVMVFRGRDNLARSGRLSANYSIDAEVGWNIHYLTDGQSPLGPPELPQPGHSLGWHGDMRKGPGAEVWAAIDLGAPLDFDTIRLIAARGDAPIKGPGFGFPVRFHFDAADAAAGPWREIWSTGARRVPNPGYNPMVFHFPARRARFVRLVVDEQDAPDSFTTPRVLLSELEIRRNGRNLSRGRPVTTTDSYDAIKHDATRVWSRAGLTDGHTSTGLIIPERDWAEGLSRRFDLVCERNRLLAGRDGLLAFWRQLTLGLLFVALVGAVVGLVIWQVRLRLAARRAVLALRSSISSDLHDEVGSNLATIALLSELPPASENLEDISRLSRETSLALREIVEITVASQRARKPLAERLREIASLMLRHQQWTFEATASPALDLERRKHFVFYFKESLHNIIRHAGARKVSIVLEKIPPDYRLVIHDDGRGISHDSADAAGNFHTLRQRAERLHGTLEVDSALGEGTRLTLHFPIQPRRK